MSSEAESTQTAADRLRQLTAEIEKVLKEVGTDAASSLGQARTRVTERARSEWARARPELERAGAQLKSSWTEDVRPNLERLGEKARPRLDAAASGLEEALTRLFHGLGLPHLRDLEVLSQRIEELTARLNEISDEPGAGAEPVTFSVRKGNGGWLVESDRSPDSLGTHGTKKEALAAAQELVRARVPSVLVIHRADGTVQDTRHYEEE